MIYSSIFGNATYLPNVLEKASGLSHEEQAILAQLNDRGVSFDTIADFIECYVPSGMAITSAGLSNMHHAAAVLMKGGSVWESVSKVVYHNELLPTRAAPAPKLDLSFLKVSPPPAWLTDFARAAETVKDECLVIDH